MSTVEILKFLEAFIDEDDYTVWSSICNCLSKLHILMSHTDFDDLFIRYGLEMLSTINNRLGWDMKKDDGKLANIFFFLA